MLLAGLPPAAEVSPELEELIAEGRRHLQNREYEEAVGAYERASARAEREGQSERAMRMRLNAAGVSVMMQQFPRALKSLQETREMARARKLPDVEAAAWANLAALYMAVGDGDAAAESLAAATEKMPAASAKRGHLMAQAARLEFRRGGVEVAAAKMGEALWEAQRAGDMGLEGLIWDDLAMLRMEKGDLEGAETALANEYRLWALHKTPNPEYLHWRIGRLRIMQGRHEEALRWLERTRSHAKRSLGSVTPHLMEYDRALALEGAGRRMEAFEAARRAWRWSREWRQEVLPAQSAQMAADVGQAEMAALYARLGGGASGYWEEVFVAVEQSRAGSLRSTLLNRPMMRERLGPEYTRTLLSWRSLTARWLGAGGGGEEPREIGRLRGRLAEIEAGVGYLSEAPEVSGVARRRLSGRLGVGEVLFSFLLGEPDSYAWLLTRDGVRQARLPGRAELTRQVERFRAAVVGNEAVVPVLSAEMYATLFGFAGGREREARCWYLSLDDALLALPFGALRDGGANGRWLVEQRRLTVLPSAYWLMEEAGVAAGRGLLAVGDAVHNLADRRFEGLRGRGQLFGRGETLGERLELPALAGSGRELERVAAVWREAGRPVEVLAGVNASLAGLAKALREPPGALHFATHVLPVPEGRTKFLLRQGMAGGAAAGLRVVARPDDAFLALSIQADGTRDGINTATVPAYDVPGSVVVLNGCSSGAGQAQAGAGVMGFARAWMAAGAASVVVSLWPLADDTGGMFERFYRGRLGGRSPSESLQGAQVEMIRGQGWRAEPRHWAAYIAVGRE